MAGPFKVVLVNPYELGRQPFALAEPAAWLKRAGFDVRCLDLSLETLDAKTLAEAGLVAVYVGMHTATRIAIEALPRIRRLAPNAHLCVYGLYAPMNEDLLRGLGVGTVLGGEVEPALLSLCEELRSGATPPTRNEPVVSLERVAFVVPDRSGLPHLSRYAHLVLPDGSTRHAGFAEASRGCKHLCRHCPIVPVYQGQFRVVPLDVVLEDVRAQVAAGAQHITFGDPDFLNGPTHARHLIERVHAEFPDVSYDVTTKIEHLLNHADMIPVLRDTGCLFISSAVEAIDDSVLDRLRKGHTRADFVRVAALCRDAGITLVPTFVPFTPWTTLGGYVELLDLLRELDLVEHVAPIQLAIRLLVTAGSPLLDLPEVSEVVSAFDPASLTWPWRHHDVRVDALQTAVMQLVSGSAEMARPEVFGAISALARAHASLPPRRDHAMRRVPVPYVSEPWYCCAEPMEIL